MTDARTLTDAPRSRLDPELPARRDFLGLAALVSAGATLLFGLVGALRLPRAAVLPTPSKKFTVTLPESLGPGQPHIPPGRNVALFRDGEGVFALSTVCTHLGCIVKSTAEGFDCPCHGSKFHADGSVARGPAPKGLPWLSVSAGAGGAVIVDEGKTVAPGSKTPV